MYAVSIRYPRKKREEFSFQHWASVHMPMGLAIFNKTNGIAPKRVMIQHSVVGIDGKPESTDAYATVWLMFDSREGLEGFMKLHNDSVASKPLADDFKNYAPLPPHIALGEVEVFENIQGLIASGNELLRRSDAVPEIGGNLESD